MTHSSRRASLLVASTVVIFTGTTALAAAKSTLPTDITGFPDYITHLVAGAPGNHPHHHHHYAYHHHHARESLDTRRARYALAHACATGSVGADVCKFTAGLITLAK